MDISAVTSVQRSTGAGPRPSGQPGGEGFARVMLAASASAQGGQPAVAGDEGAPTDSEGAGELASLTVPPVPLAGLSAAVAPGAAAPRGEGLSPLPAAGSEPDRPAAAGRDVPAAGLADLAGADLAGPEVARGDPRGAQAAAWAGEGAGGPVTPGPTPGPATAADRPPASAAPQGETRPAAAALASGPAPAPADAVAAAAADAPAAPGGAEGHAGGAEPEAEAAPRGRPAMEAALRLVLAAAQPPGDAAALSEVAPPPPLSAEGGDVPAATGRPAPTPLPQPPGLPPGLPSALALALPQEGGGSVALTLAPEELGKVRIDLRPEGDLMRIVIAVERPETLDLLRRHADVLAMEFRQSGFAQTSLSFAAFGEGGGGGSALPPPDGDGRGDRGAPAGADTLPPPRPTLLPGQLDLRL